MKKIFHYMTIVPLCSVLASACTEAEPDIIGGDGKDFPYDPAREETVYIREAPVDFKVIDMQLLDEHLYSFTVVRGEELKGEQTVGVAFMTEDEVRAESPYYKRIPEEYLDLSSSSVTLGQDHAEAVVALSLKPENKEAFALFMKGIDMDSEVPCLGVKLTAQDDDTAINRALGYMVISLTQAPPVIINTYMEGVSGPFFYDNVLVSYTDLNVLDGGNQDAVSDFRIVMNCSSDDLIGNLHVNACLNNELAEQYNRSHGTDYDLLEDGAVTLSASTFTLSSDSPEAVLTIGTDPEKFTGSGQYLAAFELSSPFAEIDNKVFYLLIESPLVFSYEKVYAPASAIYNPENDKLEYLWDTWGAHWHSTWVYPEDGNSGIKYYANERFGHFIQVCTADNPLNHGVSFNYWPRLWDYDSINTDPKHIKIFVSSGTPVSEDEEGYEAMDWTEVYDIHDPDYSFLPHDTVEDWNGINETWGSRCTFEGKVSAPVTYVRFCIMETNGLCGVVPDDFSGDSLPATCLAELKMWGD